MNNITMKKLRPLRPIKEIFYLENEKKYLEQ